MQGRCQVFKQFQFPDIHESIAADGGEYPSRRTGATLALSGDVAVGMQYCNISNTISRTNHLTQ
jgi:hypothetical protein